MSHNPPASALNELWYTRCSVPTPLSFAAQFGWLDQEFSPDGIQVRSLRESEDPAVRASHYDHSLQHSVRQGGSVPPIWARANGTETRVIGLSWTDEFQAILALPGSGIRNVKDLKGRRIGLPRHETRIDHNRASALRAFILALATEGRGMHEVEIVDLDDARYPDPAPAEDWRPLGSGRRRATYANELYALVRGEVDAVYVKDVRGLELANLTGAQVVADLGFHPDPFVRISNCAPRPLTINAETIEQHPKLVQRFLGRVIAAGEWARSHPQETITWIARETGWSERLVRQSYGPDVHLHLGLDLDVDKVRGIDSFKNFLVEQGFLKGDYDTAQWVDARPLEAFRSQSSAGQVVSHALA